MAVALGDDRLAVGVGDLGSGQELGYICPEAHRPTHVREILLVGHQVDDRSRGCRVNLPRVGTCQIGEITCHVYDHDLESQAETQAWDVVLPRIAGRCDLALYPPLAEPTRDNYPVETVEPIGGEDVGHVFGLHEFDVDLAQW